MLICDEQISMGAQNTGVMATILDQGRQKQIIIMEPTSCTSSNYIHIKLWLGSDRFGYDNGWIP